MSALTDEVGMVPLAYDTGFVNAAGGGAPAFGTDMVIDAATEKAAFVGCVWHPTVKTGTIAIRKVHFRCGAVTMATATLRVSLQTISATAGPPYQPDGTQDQTADLTSLTANGWNATGNLSADRTVDLSADSIGDTNSRWLAVVFEFASGWVADSVVVSDVVSVTHTSKLGGQPILNTASWALLGSRVGNVVFECADGTYAFLIGSSPWSALSSASVSSTGAIRRAGVKFKVPTQRKINRLGLLFAVPNGCDGRLVLYDSDGTTELVSVDIDNDAVNAANSGNYAEVEFAPVTLAADTFYRCVFVGGTSTAATMYYGEVNVAGMMAGLILGANAMWTEHDGATWTDTATRRPAFAIGVCAYHDGAGGGGVYAYGSA